MKPNKCPYALVYDGIKLCLGGLNIHFCERVEEKDCFVSDEYKNPFELLFKDEKERKE